MKTRSIPADCSTDAMLRRRNQQRRITGMLVEQASDHLADEHRRLMQKDRLTVSETAAVLGVAEDYLFTLRATRRGPRAAVGTAGPLYCTRSVADFLPRPDVRGGSALRWYRTLR